MTYDGINIGEAVQPIQNRVETFQSNGYAVINPGDSLSAGAYAVTVNSGNLDASDTLIVGSSSDEIIFDGSTKSLSSATNIGINSVSAAGDGTEQYRYDVIYADSSGEVQKTEGSVTKLDSRESQNNLTRFERFKGAIPNPGTDPSVIIAAVIVNSNDSSVGTSQLRDYRVGATHKVSTLEAVSLIAEEIGPFNYAAGFSGSNPDDRLDNVLSATPDGTTILLESANYTQDRTISKRTTLKGTNPGFNQGTAFDADWTLTEQCVLDGIRGKDTASLTVSGDGCSYLNSGQDGGFTITVKENRFRFINHFSFANLTFQSGTSGGIVDSSVNVSVTDNGSNTVGDIS